LVKESSFQYNYDPATQADAFAQTSVFVNANRALVWLLEQGYDNFGTVPIKLYVHAVLQNDSNNALYEPRAGNSIIYVGDGDGDILQNLATDGDVVSHELGHHVVYNTIKRIDKEECLVLHEGLADYLTFARTENACLGESICPDSSVQTRVCVIPKTCLRTGENDYVYGSKTLPKEPHLRSQFVSGMLWDLHSKDAIPFQDVTRLVLKTIGLMVEDSGYRHWAIGMLLADDAFFKGANCQTIRNRLVARGLGTEVQDITCESLTSQTLITSTSTASVKDYLGPASDSVTSTAATTKRKSSTNCGMISGGGTHGHDLSYLLILGLPFFGSIIRRFRD
jgi:hypothetical protein